MQRKQSTEQESQAVCAVGDRESEMQGPGLEISCRMDAWKWGAGAGEGGSLGKSNSNHTP